MKIIKHGTPKDCLHFICDKCGCEWLATKEEADKTPDIFLVEEDDGYVMTCPDCHNVFGRTIKSYGRLIDADRLYDLVEYKYKYATGNERKVYRDLLDLICDSDTIIEAGGYSDL